MSLTYDETNEPIAYDKSCDKIIHYDESDDTQDRTTEAFGNFNVLPNIAEGFEFIFVLGSSGSGKSYWASEYALFYKKFYPNNKIYIISQKESDVSFEIHDSKDISKKLNIKRIVINENLVDKKIDITKDLENCLVIFDDFMYIDSKKEQDKINNVLIQILTMGRVNHIYCLITAHTTYAENLKKLYRFIYTEMHKLVWFKGCKFNQLEYVLSKYLSFNQNQIKFLANFGDKKKHSFTCINQVPSYVISNSKCLLLE